MSTTTTQNEKLPTSSQSAGSTTPQHVLAVDATGAAISFGGGGATIGATVPATATAIGVKDNAGNLAYPNVDASGNLLVAVTGAGSGGTSSVDGSGYTAGTTAGTPLMVARDDSSPTALAEDKVGIARGTSARAVHVNLRDAVGNEILQTLDYDTGAGTVTQGLVGIALPASGGPVAGGTSTNPIQVSLANTAANSTAVKVDASSVAVPITDNSGSLTVDNGGTFPVQAGQTGTWNISNVSGTVSLPTGAATAAKQPALGTAGASSTDVLSVQGIAGGTSLITNPASASGTLQTNATANGNGTVLTVTGYATAILTVVNTGGSGGTTINFEGLETGSTYAAIYGMQLGTNTIATSTSQPSLSLWVLPVAGLVNIRARISAYSAGTITITAHLSAASFSNLSTLINGTVTVDGSGVTQPVSGTVTANLGTISTAATAAKQPALGTAGSASADVITVQGVTSMTPLKVDGSGVTQPVSAASLPLPTGASTSAKQPALGTAGTASSDVITIQGISSMTKLLVTPDSVALPSNQSVNVNQLAGTTADTNSGTKSAGTLRVVLATDQPALTNKLLVTPDSVALPANQSVNVSQINGVTPLMGAGNTGTGSLRVTLATDQTQLTNALKVDPSGVTSPVSLASVPSHAVTNAGTFAVQINPSTSGGLLVFNGTSSDGGTALTSTAQVIKASAGQVYGWYIYNPNATAQFVQFYNTAAGSVTVGTTNPLFMLTIPATSAANVNFTQGITFSNTGFSCSATSTAGGNGAPSTALDAVVFYA